MQIDSRTILFKVAEVFDLTRDTTEERLKLQKTIYLLQVYGLKLGYGFSWYKYGPYSQDLVYDAYMVLGSERNKYKQEANKLRFSENCLEKFKEFKKICGDFFQRAENLELVASIDFLRHTWYPDAKKENMPQLLRSYKRQFFNGLPISDDLMIHRAFDISSRLRQN